MSVLNMSVLQPSTFRSRMRVFVAFLFAVLLSVAAYDAASARPGGGHGGGGFRGGGGGFHGGGGGFRGGGFHGGGFRGGGAAFHGGGMRMGGGRAFYGRSHVSRSFAGQGYRGGRSYAIHNRNIQRSARSGSQRAIASRNVTRAAALNGRNANASRNANAVRNAFQARGVNRALRNSNALRNPATRALVTSRLAMAGWHGNHGWWRHRHGGFGWVGPVFWPFAFYDIYGYSLWGYDYDVAFWDYGYPDIYAGLFAPYGYDDLMGYSGYLPGYAARSGSGRSSRDSYASANSNDRASMTQMCGDDSRDIAGLPIDAIQKALQPDDAQRAALDDLANASTKAAQNIKAACPTDIALTAPRRLAVMQQRVEAMASAVQTVQPPLDKFYGLLSDEQKAKFNSLAQKQRPARSGQTGNAAQPNCDVSQPGVTDWPGAAIDQAVNPTDSQRKELEALQSAAAKASDMLKSSCQSADANTPPARLAAVGKRLGTMLEAVKTVRAPLDSFYGSLTDEQKASFDAIGPKRMSSVDRTTTAQNDDDAPRARGRRHHHYGNVDYMIRRMMSYVR